MDAMNNYISSEEKKNLKRDIHPLPDFVEKALEEHGLSEKYRDRPAYQKNDYIGWIIGAKTEETQRKRLSQMINELREGGVYMKMEC